MRTRLADYVIRNLKNLGVDTYFSLTGRGLLYLTDALAARNDLNKIFMHHEQSCAYAACGFSDITGLSSVCMVSTGCGSTNAISGLLNAWQDNLPVIFISGQNKLNQTTLFTKQKIRTFGNQEANIIEIVKSISKYAVMVDNPQSIREILEEAYIIANSGRKGPVWIDIPLDIQSEFIDLEDIKPIQLDYEKFITDSVVDTINREISLSKNPLILIGSGIRDASVIKEFTYWIEFNNVPVVYSSSAVDILDTKSPLSIGVVGMLGGSPAGNILLQNADLVFVLGSRLSSVTTGDDIGDFARKAKIIVLDIDPEEHLKSSSRIDLFFDIDLKTFFNNISKFNKFNSSKEWTDFVFQTKSNFDILEFFRDDKEIDLHWLSRKLTSCNENNQHFIVDSGLNEIILPASGNFSNHRRCIHPYSQGSMGFALPASVGVHMGSLNKVFVMVGDGSIMLNLQELQTISSYKFPIIIIVVNNRNYSIIRTRQKELFRNRTIGTDESNGVSTPEFKNIADAFGIDYLLMKSTNDINILKQVKIHQGPLILEVITKPEQNYLKPGILKDETGKLKITSLDELHKIIKI
jgi:acetolactate synthase I/II/III large subunit